MFCAHKTIILLLAAFSTVSSGTAGEISSVERKIVFSGSTLDAWEERSFMGHTRYDLVEVDGEKALKAISKKSASGLFREQRIDLEKTPWLHWRWRIDNVLANVDERSKEGDDYPARIYVVVSGGVFFWRTRAINYVWSNNQPVGAQWDNAFTGNARMIAVASGKSGMGKWHSYKRNIRQDLKQQFGKDVRYIDAIAVMTDTDNSGQAATAWYGEIYFSRD